MPSQTSGARKQAFKLQKRKGSSQAQARAPTPSDLRRNWPFEERRSKSVVDKLTGRRASPISGSRKYRSEMCILNKGGHRRSHVIAT